MLQDIRREMSSRESCLFCARKHIAKAKAKIVEAPLGYPRHAWFAVGEMAEAEDELLQDYPEAAATVRGYRTRLMQSIDLASEVDPDRGLTLDPSKLYPVEWGALLDLLTVLALSCDETGVTEVHPYHEPQRTEQ